MIYTYVIIEMIDTYRYYNIVKICDHRNDRYIQVL